uniref:RING-type domain-containing protein n=1 Tax=Kalanchoe fedtschenkoi TaxID=63787 RepID=A0A7N0U7B8_KALFE
MSLLVKFRSAEKFHTVRLGDGQPTISLQNLRTELAGLIPGFPLHDDASRGFDLVFYDAVSEEVFNEHNPQIRSGTTVFIKRVPHTHRVADQASRASPDRHPELRCRICRDYLREAMLILCCHQTFCKHCIDKELRKGRCPACMRSGSSHLIPNRLVRTMVDRFVYSRNPPGSAVKEECPKHGDAKKKRKHQSADAAAPASSKRMAVETNVAPDSTSEKAGTSGQQDQDGRYCYQGNLYNWNGFTGCWSGGYPIQYSRYNGYRCWAAPIGAYMLYWNPFYGYWQGMDPSNYASTSTAPFPYQSFRGHIYGNGNNHNYFSSGYQQAETGPSQRRARPESTDTSEEHMDSKRRGKSKMTSHYRLFDDVDQALSSVTQDMR